MAKNSIFKKFLDHVKSNPDKIRHALEYLLLTILIVASAVVGTLAGIVITSYKSLPSLDQLTSYRPKLPTKIYDYNGNIIAEFFEQKREPVSLSEVPQYLIDAVIVTEDPRFFHHFGVDPLGIVRAMIKNLLAGRIVQGGSTLTQQLARNLFLTQKRTLVRKIKEAILAVKIEHAFSKEEILEMYLNQIYLGHGCYGVEAASQYYFGKSVKDITLGEAAMLVALISSPEGYSPFRHPERARKKQWIVLKKLVKAGYITKDEAKKAFEEFWLEWTTKPKKKNPLRINEAPYFTEYVRRQISEKYGPEALYTEGLQIYTTLDLNLQKKAQEIVFEHLKELNSHVTSHQKYLRKIFIRTVGEAIDLIGPIAGYGSFRPFFALYQEKFKKIFNEEVLDTLLMVSSTHGANSLFITLSEYKELTPEALGRFQIEGALLSMEPQTGYIKAMVGGSRFSQFNQINRAVQTKRQPGSAFKLFVYTAAIESRKYTTQSILNDSPVVFLMPDGSEWIPRNYHEKYYGEVTLRKALALSLNVATVKLAMELGINRVIEEARKLGIESDLMPAPSLALGTSEVSLIEMVRAYATIANQGKLAQPMAILRVEDRDGNILEDNSPQLEQRVEPAVAYIMTTMLETVVRAGTAKRTVGEKFPYPAAGKTGTTDDWSDAWFIGYTPELATGVWVGYDRGRKSLGQGMSGAVVAGPIWTEFMLEATKPPIEDFKMPPGVVIAHRCDDPSRIDYFLPGTIPKGWCTGRGTSNQTTEGINESEPMFEPLNLHDLQENPSPSENISIP